MHFIIFVRQIFCKHSWNIGETISTGKSDNVPYFIKRCTCTKCGRIEDIKFPWW